MLKDADLENLDLLKEDQLSQILGGYSIKCEKDFDDGNVECGKGYEYKG